MNAAERQTVLTSLRAKLRPAWPEAASAGSEAGPLAPFLGPAWRPGGTGEFCGPEAATLTLAAWLAARVRGRALFLDPAGEVHPPALAHLGVDLDRVLFVRPLDRRACLWAAEQALRCPGVAVTVCRLGTGTGVTALRRLKLAAEAGGGIGLFVRRTAREPPFSDARLAVRPLASEGQETLRPRLAVETLYQRGGTEGLRCVVELSADARLVSVSPAVARPAGSRRRLG